MTKRATTLAKKFVVTMERPKPVKKKTTVGGSNLSRPLNKSKRRNWKRYRGQGK
jgi:hypothetical protein